MPIYCCGFNEFGQVSSAAVGYVSVPMVIDLQSGLDEELKEKTECPPQSTNAAAAGKDDHAASVVNVGISWSGIYYVCSDGRIYSQGPLSDVSAVQQTTSEKQHDLLQLISDVTSVSCGWTSLCFISHGLCYIYDGITSLWSSFEVTQADIEHVKSLDSSQDINISCNASANVVMTEATNSAMVQGADCEHFISVSTNDISTLVLTSNRSLMSICQSNSTCHPQRLLTGLKIASVSCGRSHTLILTAIGVVMSCGRGSHGQLGHGDLESVDSPRVIEALEGVRMRLVTVGGWHSMSLSDSDDIYVWGWNDKGQLGLCLNETDEETDSKPTLLTLPHVLDLPLTSRDLSLTSDDLLTDPDTEVYAVKLACGSRHSLAVTSDGHAYSWGCNDYGQLGHGDLVSRDWPTVVQYFVQQNLQVIDVFAGYWNSVFITS